MEVVELMLMVVIIMASTGTVVVLVWVTVVDIRVVIMTMPVNTTTPVVVIESTVVAGCTVKKTTSGTVSVETMKMEVLNKMMVNTIIKMEMM